MSCTVKLGVKVALFLLLLINTVLQFVALVTTSWGCKTDSHDLCEFEGLFQHCWNGTCIKSVRYNGLATLATSSFTISFLCVLIYLILVWRTYRIVSDAETAIKEVFQRWTVWWKWITILLLLSNMLAAVVLLIGAWQYDRVSTLILFCFCSIVITLVLCVALTVYLMSYMCKFVKFFTLEE